MHLLVRFLLFFCVCHQAVAQSSGAQQILATEQRRFEAMTNRDTLKLRGLLSNDLIYVHSNALTETKKQHLSAIASGRLKYESMIREQATVRRYGKTALVNGFVRVKGLSENKSFEVQLLYTAVYRKQKGQWQLLSWQSTKK